MSFNFAHVWATMAPLSKGVAMVLLAMAISFIGVTIERLIAFAKSAKESRLFAGQAGKLLEERRLEELVMLAKKHEASTLARLFGPVIVRFVQAYEGMTEGALSPVELARNEAGRRLEAIGAAVQPEYPPDVKAAGVEGTVLVRYVVTDTGEVKDVKAVKGPPELFAVCVAAVKSLHFKPAHDAQGNPISVVRYKSFHFKIKT